MELLRTEQLSRTYGKGRHPAAALRDVSFCVQKGEFIAVTGPSGSGKSTLLHLLGAVDSPSSGRILVDGKDIFSASREESAIFRRRHIGLVYQFYNLVPTLSVEQNILLPLTLDGRTGDRDYLDRLIHTLGLDEVRNRLPGALSGGQQQRAAIGRALINTPVLVLADEPTGSLDRRAGQELMDLLKYTNRNYHQTIIMATHDESLALQTGRIIELSDGQIRSDTGTDEKRRTMPWKS